MANGNFWKLRRALKQGGLPSAVSVAKQAVSAPAVLDPGKVGGIDTDQYSGLIDWVKVRNNGVQFGIIRVGEGAFGVSRNFYDSQKFAKGIVQRHFYWYLNIQQSANGQARDCLQYLAGDWDADSILFADFEDTYSFGRGSKYEHLNAGFLHGFLDTCATIATNLKLGIYTGLSFWAQYGSADPAFAKFPLWLSWPVSPYRDPPALAPWPTYLYHQFSFAGDERLYCAPDLNYKKG